MDKRKNNKGTIGNKGGRPPKADEQQLIERLNPMHPMALKAIENGLKDSQSWAVKLFMEYYYGKPQQYIKTEILSHNSMTLTLEEIDQLKIEK
jgi:hypothetical protein